MTSLRSVLLMPALTVTVISVVYAKPVQAAGLGLTVKSTLQTVTANTGLFISDPSYTFDYTLEGASVTTFSDNNNFFRWSSAAFLDFVATNANPAFSFSGAFDPASIDSGFVELSRVGAQTKLELVFNGPAGTGLETSNMTPVTGISTSLFLNQTFKDKVTIGCINCTIAEVFTANQLIVGSSVDTDNSAGSISTDGAEGGATFSVTDASGPAAVPAPLPVLGAGAAFGFSRRLRKRIKLRTS